MQEAEVSLRIAIYCIVYGLTKQDVNVSLDGAHIKTNDVIHFDVFDFMNKNGCKKTDGDNSRWQGKYSIAGYDAGIMVSSKPGVGDVNVQLLDGTRLYIESKKGKNDKRNSEYPLMREAIGQLMTGCPLDDSIVPIVAVPYTEKSNELAMRWSEYEQIKKMKIHFMLVHENGDVKFV